MTTLLIIFIWTGSRWEFSNIERLNSFGDTSAYCTQLASQANSKDVRAFCMDDKGEEA